MISGGPDGRDERGTRSAAAKAGGAVFAEVLREELALGDRVVGAVDGLSAVCVCVCVCV